MSTLLIIGAGGHGRVVADAAMSSGAWTSVCFADDDPTAKPSMGFEVVGTSADLASLAQKYRHAVVGIGSAHARLDLLARCRELGFELPPVIHRAAVVSPFASIGPGTVVFALAAVNPGAVLDRGCIVNTSASVDHDCRLGEGVHVCPGVHLAGNVTVGPRTWIGIGSCVRQGVCIGADVVVGAGAAVVSDIASGLTAVGVPARSREN